MIVLASSEEERSVKQMQTLSACKTLAQLFTANEKAVWSEIYSIGMSPCYASLVIVASHNGCLRLIATMCLSHELSLSTSYPQESS
ncbi:unnamed protein product [Microthlaspi erraticum]|uniref:Uncharacterized protein n=1 Tax=Microthlaspi erraticum TaxID=1685480 RepID=A0A6D2HSS0_9BRAS|nr:unnamed protein product [Microthlaspi erraticum]